MFQVARQGAVCVLSGESPLTQAELPALAELVRDTPMAGQPMVVLDLQKIPLIDSAGLEFLLDLHDDLERRGGRLKLAAAGELCRDILRVTGVGDWFESHSDVRSAVGSFTK